MHVLTQQAAASSDVADALRRAISDFLSARASPTIWCGIPNWRFFSGPASFNDGGLLDSDTVREVARRNGTRFVLSGDASGIDGSVVFTARLHDGATGRLLWSEGIAGHPVSLGDQVAARVGAARRDLARRLDVRSATPDFAG
jgi:hypothetical protein